MIFPIEINRSYQRSQEDVKLASIIIAVRNDKRLRNLLESLSHQTLPRKKYQILVIENGSHIFKDLAKEYQAEYYHLKYANTPAARNLGLSHSTGKYALFTDADCVVSVDWISNLVNFLEANTQLVGCGGPIRSHNPKSPVQKYGSNLVWGQSQLSYILTITPFPYIVTANAAFHLEKVRDIGGFDCRLLSGNDVDLCYRLASCGNKINICPNAVVFHNNRSTVSAHFRRYFRYATYQALIYKKHNHNNRQRIRINPYPYKCLKESLSNMLRASYSSFKGDNGPLWCCFLLSVEGIGTLAGGIYGAFKFHVAYF